MLGALLKQLVAGLAEVPGEIVRAYEDQRKTIGGRRLRLTEIVKMLQTTSSSMRTLICIDALDECVPQHRVQLLDSLNKILQESPGTRIFVTGRPHVQPEITRRLAGRVTSLCIRTKRQDIIRYLRSRLAEDTIPDAMDSSLEAEILKKIPEDVSEMYVEIATLEKLPQASADRYMSRFLLVALNIDAVLRETTIHRRRQKLSAMTDGLGLGDAYISMLGRIKRQGEEGARLGMAALMWISHSERHFKVDELCHALAVEIGSPNLHIDNAPSLSTLLACCQGLVAVEKATSTVRLIHFTLQEYLRAHPEIFAAAHSTMAETCLTYLNSQQVKALSISPSPNLRDTPFLEYSSLYWGVHAKRDLSDCAKQLALKLFNDYNSHISTIILLKSRLVWGVDPGELSGFSGLHCSSFFGIVEIVATFLEMGGYDVNQKDFTGGTPLFWAALSGQEGVVKILLAVDGLSPDEQDIHGETPLQAAAFNGHDGVVKILLGRADANPDKPNIRGETPLHSAAWHGREGVVKMLVGQNGVNPDRLNIRGETPLSLAARNNKEGVVRIILGRGGVNPDQPNTQSITPLRHAAGGGFDGIVKMLLGRDDVNPNKPDSDHRTPLYWAARNGHMEAVIMLLGRDGVNPNEPDLRGETPLHVAACNGHARVVEILLGRDDVNPDKPNIRGETPLNVAVWNGHERVVRILLGQDGVNPNKLTIRGETPLTLAVRNRHEGVVKILLERDDINRDKRDNTRRKPLRWADRREW